MPSHFIKSCSCGAIIAQCRCAAWLAEKPETIIEDGCPKCKTAASVRAEIREAEELFAMLKPAQQRRIYLILQRLADGPVTISACETECPLCQCWTGKHAEDCPTEHAKAILDLLKCNEQP